MAFNTSTYISTQTTTTITATGSCVIRTVIIPKTTGGTITFQSTSSTPVVYFVLPSATIAGSYLFDAVAGNGLAVVTAAGDVAIVNTSI